MPNAKVLKPRPAEPKLDALKPKARADGTGHRAKRASSCTRCCHDNARDPVAMETRGRAPAAASKARHGTTATAATSRGASRSQPPSTHTKARSEVHSHTAFTVFAPNPKKRRDIQRKAEAELAALEDLRLSRAVNYVSISPSAVGKSPVHAAIVPVLRSQLHSAN
ncbi:hypothetical protein NFI96_013729, partial [Prochilodus magdalenae]